MIQRCVQGLLLVLLLFPFSACRSARPGAERAVAVGAPLGVFSGSLNLDEERSVAAAAEAYAERVRALLTDLRKKRAQASEDRATMDATALLLPFFDGLVAGAELLREASTKSDEALRALERFRDRRQELDKVLSEAEDALDDLALVTTYRRSENKAYSEEIGPFLADEYVEALVQRAALFERKYFHGEDEGGNFLEGWINGKLSFTQFDDDSDAWYRDEGVSHFETTVRVEPLVTLESEDEAAVLLSAGLLYHFFPEVQARGFEAVAEDSFFSKHVRRMGIRLGAGVMESSGFVAGSGLQLRAFTLWGIRDFGEDDWVAMIGVSDLAFLADLVPWYDG